MNRVHAASSTVRWVGIGGVLWLAATASFGADANKTDGNEASRTARQQRLDAAQRRLERAAQEVADLSMSLSEEDVAGTAAARSRSPQRAVLGVGIDTDDDEEREEGVEVISVSPGGAASDAGLKSGDVLVALNNKTLKRDEDGSPRTKLLAVMRAVKPGDKVSVKYNRDGKIKTVDVVVKSIVITNRAFAYAPRFDRRERIDIPSLSFRTGGGILGNAELVPLTPKLGQYFGTEKGLLVVRAPADDELDLEDGDVILEIDGREPNSTSHAMRILSSYQPGEKLTFTVMRKKRRTNVEVVVPENVPAARIEHGFERSLRNLPGLQPFRRGISVTPFPPPVPSAPPAPSAPPIAAIAPLAPLPPLAPPSIEIQPLPDDAVQVY